MEIATYLGGFHIFPSQVGVWQMTAAQRALLLGKPKKEATGDTDASADEMAKKPYRPEPVGLAHLMKINQQAWGRIADRAGK